MQTTEMVSLFFAEDKVDRRVATELFPVFSSLEGVDGNRRFRLLVVSRSKVNEVNKVG